MLKDLLTNIYLMAPLILVGSFALVLFIIPRIIWIVIQRDLIDYPNSRSSHKTATPSLAGISFFITLILSMFFIKIWDDDLVSLNLIAAITVMFYIGLKDDLVYTSPRGKIGGELIATAFVLFCSCMQVTSLNGFLGIYGLPPLLSFVLLFLLVLTIINAYNLIDGIDGLAATIGLVIFSVYALIFFGAGLYYYFLLCLSLVGILIGYLRYNLSRTDKIFMGDTGSLILGFCIAFFTLKFLAMEPSQINKFAFNPENRLLVVAAILCIPLFDTFRVIGVRLLNKKNPFSPDRNHMHHILTDSGLSHIQASLLLGFFNYVIVILTLFLSAYVGSVKLLVVLVLIFVVLLVVFYKLKASIQLKKDLGKKLT